MTTPCSFYSSKVGCRRGLQCMFSHENRNIAINAGFQLNKDLPAEEKSVKMCSFYMRGLCYKGDSCSFSHGQNSDVDLFLLKKAENCRFFELGQCQRGDACQFEHNLCFENPKPPMVGPLSVTSAEFVPKLPAVVEEQPQVQQHVQQHKERFKNNINMMVCKYYAKGTCSKLDCPFLHDEPEMFHEYGEADAAEPVEIIGLQELQSNERNVIGLTRCVFGPGAEVIEVRPKPRSLLVQTQWFPCDESESKLRAIFEQFGKLVSFELKTSEEASKVIRLKPISTAFVKLSYETSAVTVTAISALKSTKYVIEYSDDVVKRKRAQAGAVNQSRFVKVEWFAAPPSTAFLHFRKAEDAMRAAQVCDNKVLHGCTLTCSYQRPTSYRQRENFTTIANFSGMNRLTETDFHGLLNDLNTYRGFTSVDIKQPHHNNSPHSVRSLLKRFGRIESFQVLTETRDSNKNKRVARVTFTEAKSAFDATAALSGNKHRELNNTPLYITPYFACKFTVLRDQWVVVESEITTLQAAFEASETNRVRMFVFQGGPIVTLRLTSSDARQLATVKILFEEILKGTVLFMNSTAADTPASVVWHDTFAGPACVALLKSFVTNTGTTSPVFLLREENRRQLRGFGKPSDLTICSAAIEQYIEQCKSQQHTVAILHPGVLNALLKADRLSALQQHCGATSKPVVSFAQMTLQLTGDAIMKQRAVSYLLNLAQEVEATNQVRGSNSVNTEGPMCPVCMCPVEVDDDVRKLGCGHSYCTGCFTQFLAQCHGYDAKFPICCLADKCGAPLSLVELESSLAIQETESLYLASLKSYVSQNPHKINFCITPDCPQVFTWDGADDLLAQCSTCFASICTACKVESHDGLSCAQYKAQKSGDTEFAKWKKEHDVKECPRCNVTIERSEGCNHMSCTNCKIHICWKCLKTFDDGTATYAHMKKAHGDYFG